MKSTSARDFDPKDYRRTLGHFATGVAIVTARSREGCPIGLTVNSFTSVSLEPPLVLWCLVRHSPNLQAFQETSHFAVNILAAGQHGLSQRFASPVLHKFEGVQWEEGKARIPLLAGVAARLVCRNVGQFDGGDHVIFLGQVEEYRRSDEKPLVFHAGRYRSVTPHPDFPE